MMPPKKPIRRGQLLSPFGIGSMVDFPRDESLMPAGLDVWPYAKENCPTESGWLIREERLEARLGVSHFRLPPDHRDPDTGTMFTNVDVPFVRFPQWHYCHHCGGMELVSMFSSTRERCHGRHYEHQSCENKAPNRRPFLIPVRFIAACDLGHIQEFPFMEWVHRSKSPAEGCKLRLRAGRSSAGLTGIVIECSCGLKETLGDMFRFSEQEGGPLSSLGYYCKGQRPWLGEANDSTNICGHHLRVLQRGASNVYFPNLVSAIYLPLWAEEIDSSIIQILEDADVWSTLSSGLVNGTDIDPAKCYAIAALVKVNAKKLLDAAQRKLENKPSSSNIEIGADEENFRRSEYQAISEGKVGPQTELYVECVENHDFKSEISQYFSKIRLVHKLRETRALTSFTRILPPDGNLSSTRLQSLKLDPQINWLPAIKVYGEGIFIELNADKLKEWLSKEPRINKRVSILKIKYNRARLARQQPNREVSAKFILLHTFAHILINQLSFDCGYGSASLRERLYCDFTDPSNPMNGILIYTASGDSEGSMGGLVRQGKPGRLEITIYRALNHAAWCSSDPVCIESSGQGSDNSNLAACHSCSLLPETSCEEGNRLLDRALLVGTPEYSTLGFFSGLLQ